MKVETENIAGSLIYEMVDGNPIFFRGYKDFILEENNFEKPLGSGLLQSMIISRLVILLNKYLGDQYYVLTNELGLQISKNNWRAADIAIFEKSQINPNKLTSKYIDIPPRVVIEIDTKAEIEEVKDTFTYYNQKTDQLLEFGVEKIIWIFTDSEKVMVAQKEQNWQLLNWNKDVHVLEQASLNIAELIEAI